MSRDEGKIGDENAAPVDAASILAALSRSDGAGAERRTVAVSRYLSVGEGWQKASGILGGAFAAGEKPPTGDESGRKEK